MTSEGEDSDRFYFVFKQKLLNDLHVYSKLYVAQ